MHHLLMGFVVLAACASHAPELPAPEHPMTAEPIKAPGQLPIMTREELEAYDRRRTGCVAAAAGAPERLATCDAMFPPIQVEIASEPSLTPAP